MSSGVIKADRIISDMLASEHPGRRVGWVLYGKAFWWIMILVSERNVVHRGVTLGPAGYAYGISFLEKPADVFGCSVRIRSPERLFSELARIRV